MKLGELLRKKIREELKRGATLYQVGKGSGIDQGSLAKFISDPPTDIRLSTVELLCDYYGLKISEGKPKK